MKGFWLKTNEFEILKHFVGMRGTHSTCQPCQTGMAILDPTKKNVHQVNFVTDVLPWYDSRAYKASPHDNLSKKLNEPYTNAQPFKSSPTSMLSMLIPVTCFRVKHQKIDNKISPLVKEIEVQQNYKVSTSKPLIL